MLCIWEIMDHGGQERLFFFSFDLGFIKPVSCEKHNSLNMPQSINLPKYPEKIMYFIISDLIIITTITILKY